MSDNPNARWFLHLPCTGCRIASLCAGSVLVALFLTTLLARAIAALIRASKVVAPCSFLWLVYVSLAVFCATFCHLGRQAVGSEFAIRLRLFREESKQLHTAMGWGADVPKSPVHGRVHDGNVWVEGLSPAMCQMHANTGKKYTCPH